MSHVFGFYGLALLHQLYSTPVVLKLWCVYATSSAILDFIHFNQEYFYIYVMHLSSYFCFFVSFTSILDAV